MRKISFGLLLKNYIGKSVKWNIMTFEEVMFL